MPKRSTPKPVNSGPVYQLLVTLEGTRPTIWRRLQVPGNANLGWLHAALQVAMGWTNSHLHQFFFAGKVFSAPSVEWEVSDDDPSSVNESEAMLSQVLTSVGEALVYEYDFGDSWEHTVLLEKTLPPDLKTKPAAICIEGKRACPPEDCGGICGYMDLLKVLKNPKHPDYKDMKEWLGRTFDATRFDLATTNAALRKLKWPDANEDGLRRVLMARDGYRE